MSPPIGGRGFCRDKPHRPPPRGLVDIGGNGFCVLDEWSALLEPDLVGVWPLFGDQLVTSAAWIVDPDDFTNPINWARNRLTTPTAHEVFETAVVGSHSIYQTLSGQVSVGPYQWSIDVEAAGTGFVRLRTNTGATNQYAWVNLSTGAVYGEIGCNAFAQSLGGGRWRVGMTDASFDAAGGWIQLYLSQDGSSVSYLGIPANGIRMYNAQIDQTSIVTAPNLYGDRALAAYGDRFDLTNATKTTQPVVSADGWDGDECAIFSAANLLTADAAAALFTGEDKPLTWAFAQECDGGVLGRLASITSSTAAPPIHMASTQVSNVQAHFLRDDSNTVKSTPAGTLPTNVRSILLQTSTGQVLDTYHNGAADIVAADRNLGACTVDWFTVGALRYFAGVNTQYAGKMRLVVLAKRALTAPEAVHLSALMQRWCRV